MLVSLIVPDSHTGRAQSFVASCGQPVAVSDFGMVEVASGLGVQVRMRRLTANDARQAMADLRTWVVRNAEDVQLQSADMAFAHAAIVRFDLNLRAPDALQIAAAYRVGATLATFDRKQAAGAAALGVVAVEP